MDFRFSAEKFASKQKKLLHMEYQAEEQEVAANRALYTTKELEAKGIAINKLKLTETSSGLYGKLLIHLQSAKKRKLNDMEGGPDYVLPTTKLGSGDIVGIFQASEHLSTDPLISGVIYKINIKEISIAIDKAAQDTESLYESHLAVLMLPNDITYKRCVAAVDSVDNPETTDIPFLWDVLLELQKPREGKSVKIVTVNKDLNESQVKAVEKGLEAKDVYLVHGPPGTGKTTTIVEYILQEVMRGNKVITCGPSNMSVDNIVEKLIKSSVKKLKICRVGHPARMIPQIWDVSLDALVNSSEEAAMARKAKAELNKLLPKMMKSKDKEEKRQMRTEIKLLKKDIKKFEKQAVKKILDNSDVILGTNTGIADKKVWEILKTKKYIVVIDEAAQAIEASCWIPIRLASKVVLAGDHKQLAPTIKSIDAAKQGLEITLFERLMEKYKEFSSLLDIQYRMNNTIMNWSSGAMYEGLLKADKSVANSSLKKKKLTDEQVLESDMLLIDTAGCQFGESVDDKDENDSKYNIG